MAIIRVSCVFPVHNEAQILRREINRFIAEAQAKKIPLDEIILVENGSQDSSWRIIQHLHQQDHRINGVQIAQASYGQAIRTGLEIAKGKIVFVFNVDFFDIDFMIQAIPLLAVTDIVVASKTLSASQDRRSFLRRNLTYVFNAFLRLMLNYPGTDTHGIKAFKKTPLFLFCVGRCRTRNELFDTELIIRMTRWRAKLVELPINVSEIRPSRYSWAKRIGYTLIDLLVAFRSKFLIPFFANQLVVADDYGIDAGVNKAVIEVVSKRMVHIVSIMANMASASAVRRLLRFKRQVKFSIHLNVVEGKPLSSLEKVRSITNWQGVFYPTPIFLLRLLLGLVNLKEVERELEAQIMRLKKFGVKLDHIDSHQHSHLFPPIWKIVLKLARKWRISRIRSFDSARFYLWSKPVRYVVLIVFHALLTLKYGTSQVSTKEVNEVIVHPGTKFKILQL